MAYAKLNEQNQVQVYPYTVTRFRADHPDVMLRRDPPAETLLDFGVVEVLAVAPPVADSGQVVAEGPPTFSNGSWRQTWVQRAPNPQELYQARREKKSAIRRLLVTKVSDSALANGLDEVDMDLLNTAPAFAASTLSYLFASNSVGFRNAVQACRINAKSLLSAVNAAGTLSEIQAVNETAGWPI